MAFPLIPSGARVGMQNQPDTVAARTFTSLTSLGKVQGDLLIALVCAYERSAAGATFGSWGAGFTEIADVDNGATTPAVGIATKISTGAETGTFTVTQAATVTGHCTLFLLAVHGAHQSQTPELTALATGTAAAADPASLSPSWGGGVGEDTLWIAVALNGETATTGSWTGLGTPTAPSGFTGTHQTPGIGSDVVGGVHAAVAFQQTRSAALDVGTWTGMDLSNARNGALVIAVRTLPGLPAYVERQVPQLIAQ